MVLSFVLIVSIHMIDCNAWPKCIKLVVNQALTLQGLVSVYFAEIKGEDCMSSIKVSTIVT